MSVELFLAHFNRISDAPDAVPRLRRFILDLAVRGRLVEQNSGDAPSSELLKETDKRCRLAAKRRGHTKDPCIGEPETPFALATGWQWIQFGRIHTLVRGVTYSKSDVSDSPAEGFLPILRANNIGDGLNFSEPVFVKRERISQEQILRRGDYLIALSSGSKNLVGKAAFVTEDYEGGFGGFCGVIRLPMQDLEPYVGVYLASRLYREAIAAGSRGIGINNLKKETLSGLPFPIPPLAEQHRIVAKVNELMTLCDRLEDAQREREIRRDLLTGTTHHHLNHGADAENLRGHAQFLIDHLPSLTARAGQINRLRQTTLALAVSGKLVPQDPLEGSASEELRSIAVENQRLQEIKNVRAQKSVKVPERFETETSLPKTWVRACLQELAYQITDGTHLTPSYTERGRPFLSAQNVKPFRFMPTIHRFVSDADFENYRLNRKPERDDVLVTRVGAGIGEATVLDSDLEFAFYVSLCLIKLPTKYFDSRYLVLWLNSPEGRQISAVRTYGKGASQGNLNLSQLRTFGVPLPPLAEQRRIVAKVDELMAFCDRLEARLTTAQTEASRLLHSVLYTALNSSALQELSQVIA